VRVVLVSPYSLSFPGGVQAQVLGLARALRRAGHESLVLAPIDDELPDTGLPGEAVVGVGRSLAVPANGSVARLALDPRQLWRVRRAMADFAPDVMHLHEPLAPGPTWAALALGGAPSIGTFHRAGDVRGAAVLGPLARLAARRLSMRTAVSPAAADTARRLVGGSFAIVGNGVEAARFTDAAPSATDGPTILFVGRHEQRKGLGVLLDAFARLDPHLGAVLWVAGEGPLSEGLRRAYGASARVVWLGRMSDDELAARLAGADVLCAPALHGESFGIVLVEAMLARAVVVASDIPGYAAVANGHGILVAPGDAGALAEALAAVVGDVRAGTGLAGEQALEAAAAHAAQWSMDTVAARYLELYDQARGGGS